MKRTICFLLLGCLAGCGDSRKAASNAFDANDLEQSFHWMQSVYEQVKQAEEQGNALLVDEAKKKAETDLKKMEGTSVQWTLNVETLDFAEPIEAEMEGKPAPPGFVVKLEAPAFQKNDEEEDLLLLYFSRTNTAQEDHPYLIHLDEKDREYARTLTKGTPIQITATIQSITSYDYEDSSGFMLLLIDTKVVR